MNEGCWRIDELAQRTGLTVDTIRYYAREGLLEPPTKQGRHRLYDAEHLERLDRIRELQGQRFSLAAIGAIVEAKSPGIEGLFTTGERGYSLAELIERSGVDEELVARVAAGGL